MCADAYQHALQKINDGQYHLYVVHLTRSGLRDGAVYFEGNTTTLPLTPLPFGALSSDPIRNAALRRIGSSHQHGFRGEIRSAELWSGTRMNNGMTPAEYSRFRYRGGKSQRGL